MLSTRGTESLPYSPDLLKAIIRANPDSISFESLRNAFPDGPDNLAQRMLVDLYRLKADGLIKTSGGEKFFTATKPLSDLAIARVQDTHDRERSTLKLEGLEDDLPMEISIASKQIRQHRLKKGDRIFVKLSRHHGVELKAKYISKLSYNKNPILTGRFNTAANGDVRFVPNDKTIRTTFSAKGAIPKDVSHDQIFVATVPGRLDMEDPSVDIAEQRWDPQTGNKIAHIIADRHDLRIQHNDDARRSAHKLLRITRPDEDTRSRRIFENEQILVVDPINSPGDFDDGIFAEIVPGRMLRTLVVVTDVASYIHPHSRLDKYALERGRSYYFPQEREFFHMFPEVLAIRKIAMRQGHEHPVQYIEQFWDIDSGDLIRSDVGLGIVKKHKNLVYHTFQNLLNGDEPAMKAYHEFDRIAWMRDREYNIQLSDQGMEDSSIMQAKGIVQAMMGRACIGFATALEDKGTLYLRRNHAGHFNDMAYDLASDQLRAWGFDAPYESSRLSPPVINNILMEADSQGMLPKVEAYIREKLLHRAEYSVRSIGHFGVGAEYYGHFTSPIRRYADLFNQRSFHTAFGIPSYGLTDEMTDPGFAVKVANHLNAIDHRALAVERDSSRYYAIRDLQKHEGDKMVATLHNITPNNDVEILLPNFGGLRQSIPGQYLPDDWKVAPNQSGLTFQSRVFFPLNSPLRIKIGNVAPHRAIWNIDEIEPRSVRQKPAASALPPLRAIG